MKAPERLETRRLVLRQPRAEDAEAIFTRYASDAAVTRYLSWPRHQALEQTRAFLRLSEAEWERWPAGPYLVEARETGRLLGGTGLAFETADRASTGYVFARDAWGSGFATEALQAMVQVATGLALARFYALCHTQHSASQRVLEKCGFSREGILRQHTHFPNLPPPQLCDVYCYAHALKQTRR